MKWPTCDKVDKVPGVVMEDGLEVLDELLDDRLHHHPVVVTALHTDHHLGGNEFLIKNWKAVLSFGQLTGALPSRPKFPMRPPSRKNHTWWRGWVWIHFGQENVILSLDILIVGHNYCAPCMEDRRGRPAEPSWRRPTDKKRSEGPPPDLDDNHD